MWPVFVKVALNVAAGIGLSDLLDKFVKPKVPAEYYPDKISPIAGGISVFKIVWIVASSVAAVMLLRYIGKVLNISLLKKRV